MIEGYTLKTDRNLQWFMIEARMEKGNGTRKSIKRCKDYFFDGNDVGAEFRWSDRLKFYPEPSLEGWQKLFKEKITEPLSDSDYLTL